MTPSDNTNPVVKESLTTQKEEMQQGIKCIVHGCSNHTHQGKFVFNLCLPCFNYLASGEIGCTDSFLSKLPKLQSENDQLKKALEACKEGLDAVQDLMCQSEGVCGLHRNGDIALWSELCTGGHFEEWLIKLDDAVKLIDTIQSLKLKGK